MKMNCFNFTKGVFVIGLLLMISVSCTSSKAKKIEGRWERYATDQVDFKVDTLLQEVWNFDNGKLTISQRVLSDDSSSYVLKERAILKYKVGTSKLRSAIFIQEDSEHPIDNIVRAAYVGYDTNSGTNIIYKLTDDVMAFKGLGTLIYYEFYK